MLYVLTPILLILLAVLITFLIGRSVKNTHGKNEAAQILWYGNDREYFVYEMLASAFPRKNVFRNLRCPVRLPDKTVFSDIDIAVVTHGGIAVIEVKGGKGSIDNPPDRDWVQRYKDQITPVANPYRENEGHVRAVDAVLKRAGIHKVPIHNIVVYADKNVRFANDYKWLFKSDAIVKHLCLLDDAFTLSRKDVRNINAVLARYVKRTTPKQRRRPQNQRPTQGQRPANNAHPGNYRRQG